jgi:hypothetical protein
MPLRTIQSVVGPGVATVMKDTSAKDSSKSMANSGTPQAGLSDGPLTAD